jgi:hypothetical protein
MKAHERFIAAAKGLPVDRLPMIEWASWWDQTVKNWVKEKPELSSLNALELQRHFGLDVQAQIWFPPKTAAVPQPAHHGAPIVRGMKEYLALRPELFPEPRITADFLDCMRKLHDGGDGVAWFTLEGYFWFPRTLLGIEEHLYAFYDEPALYKLICEDLMNWQNKVIAYCADNFDFDFMSFAEDMSYNLGPMLSKDMFDEFLAPYYREITPLLKKHKVLSVVDSDGDITQAVDWFRGVGVQGMLPLERQAGVDVSLYIKKHPDMFFVGHFDKMIMHKGEDALRKEFERLMPSMVNGRFIPSVDHQTPPAVTYDDYVLYIKLLKEYTQKAARLMNR